MKQHMLFKLMVVLALMIALSSTGSRVHAATAAIGQFYAGCGNFSIDVTVYGNTNDGDNHDRVWYQVSDATGKILYQEFAWRWVTETAGSVVVNLGYTMGTPTLNPIKFQVIDLDGNNKLGAVLGAATYDAPCLTASHHVDHTGVFWPPKHLFGTVTAATAFFLGPNTNQLGVTAQPGSSLQVVYRTPDATWVAIFLSGNDLLWIPAGAISADLSQVPVPPTQIDRNNMGTTVAGGITAPAAAASAPTGITGSVLVDGLRLRSAPDYVSATITSMPLGAQVGILGRNAYRTFVKVSFNGTVGWCSAGFVRLSAGSVVALPVVQ